MRAPDIIDSQSRAASNDAWWRPDAARAYEPGNGNVRQVEASDTSGAWPFRLLMGFTFILLLAPQETFTFLKPFRLALLLGMLSALTYIAGRMSRGLPVVKFLPGILTALVLVGWCVLTVPVSYWPGGTIEFLVNDFFKTVLVFLLLAHIIDDMAKLKKLAWGLVLMSIPLALTTLSNFMSGSFEGGRITGYNAGLTGNPNDMALMLNLILPFAIALFLGSARGMKRLFVGGTVCLLITAIIVTFSRGGFLTLAVIVLSYMWLLRKRAERIWIPLAFVIAICALPFVPAEYYDRLSTITDIEADETGSAQTRWGDMGTAVGLIGQHPLVGVGAGMNIFAMNEARGATWTEVHNVYLQIALELGIPGLLMFFALFRKCLRNAKDAIRRTSADPRMAPVLYLSEAIRVSLLAFAVAAMFYPVGYEFFFYYIAGLAIALCQVIDREEARFGHKLSETR